VISSTTPLSSEDESEEESDEESGDEGSSDEESKPITDLPHDQ
jgi:hypothetical protein